MRSHRPAIRSTADFPKVYSIQFHLYYHYGFEKPTARESLTVQLLLESRKSATAELLIVPVDGG